MYSYLFSIFSRGFLALTGILVFVVSARLFGAEGRGTISYGISVFAALGLFMSFNLGRAFLSSTQKQEDSKRDMLSTYLFLNLALMFITALLGSIFWFFSSSSRSILTFKQICIFSLSSAYYVWNINGNPFFSSVSKIQIQDRIILAIRILIFLFLALFSLYQIKSFDTFIFFYSILLSLGSLIEIAYLFFLYEKIHFIRDQIKGIFRKSITPHFDYLAFNSFPLVLIVLSGIFLQKASIGRANFVIQMISLIFMFGLVANNKLNSYVSKFKLQQKRREILKLLYFTSGISFVMVIAIYSVITSTFFLNYFSDFVGVGNMFLLATLAIPGYLGYQFCNPFWIENHLLSQSANYTFLTYLLSLLLCPYVLGKYGEIGLVGIFTLFHLLLLPVQGLVYRIYLKRAQIPT